GALRGPPGSGGRRTTPGPAARLSVGTTRCRPTAGLPTSRRGAHPGTSTRRAGLATLLLRPPWHRRPAHAPEEIPAPHRARERSMRRRNRFTPRSAPLRNRLARGATASLGVAALVATGLLATPAAAAAVAPRGAVDPVPTPVYAAQGTGDVSALTFDDGPNPGTTPALLDLLAEHDLTAVFCVIGQNIEADGGADILRRIVADGHVLCN